MPAAPSPHPTPVTVLIDDARAFRDQHPALLARSSQEALRRWDYSKLMSGAKRELVRRGIDRDSWLG